MRVGTVGGNTLGLFGAVFSPDGDSILAQGYQGAFHLWHRQVRLQTSQYCPDKILSKSFN